MELLGISVLHKHSPPIPSIHPSRSASCSCDYRLAVNFSTLSLSPIQNVYRSRKPISLPYHTCKRSSPLQIEHTSTISAISPSTSTSGFTLTLSSSAPILTDCHIGDSICVNGACLTVTEFDSDSFKVGLAPETLKRTNLGQVKVGDKVNCERAMAAHTRFGGHMVQVSNPFLYF